jgi:hypothetical protein
MLTTHPNLFSREFDMVDMPRKVMLEIRERIFNVLDEKEYMSTKRKRSGEIMDSLVSDPAIGARIAEYYGKERVRTYIKDAVLNRYTKERTKAPDDWTPFIVELFGAECSQVATSNGVRVFRSQDGKIFVGSHGRLLKWETALRKLLEYRAVNAKALLDHGKMVESCLILMSGGAPQTAADADLLRSALANINVKVKVL